MLFDLAFIQHDIINDVLQLSYWWIRHGKIAECFIARSPGWRPNDTDVMVLENIFVFNLVFINTISNLVWSKQAHICHGSEACTITLLCTWKSTLFDHVTTKLFVQYHCTILIILLYSIIILVEKKETFFVGSSTLYLIIWPHLYYNIIPTVS